MTHEDLIKSWPSLSEFAGDIGVAYGTAKAMRRRSSIPAEYWVTLVECAKSRGISGVSFEGLAKAAQPEPAQ